MIIKKKSGLRGNKGAKLGREKMPSIPFQRGPSNGRFRAQKKMIRGNYWDIVPFREDLLSKKHIAGGPRRPDVRRKMLEKGAEKNVVLPIEHFCLTIYVSHSWGGKPWVFSQDCGNELSK